MYGRRAFEIAQNRYGDDEQLKNLSRHDYTTKEAFKKKVFIYNERGWWYICNNINNDYNKYKKKEQVYLITLKEL
jgi:hypothetical protein